MKAPLKCCRSSAWLVIADARLAEALVQLVGDRLSIGPRRSHSIDKSSHVIGKIIVAVFG